LKKEVDAIVMEASEIAIATPQPAPETAHRNVFSPDVDPTSAEFDTEEGVELHGNEGTMVDLINRCMHEEMERVHREVGDMSAEARAQAAKRVEAGPILERLLTRIAVALERDDMRVMMQRAQTQMAQNQKEQYELQMETAREWAQRFSEKVRAGSGTGKVVEPAPKRKGKR
jgi:hypothetical protein